MDLMRAPTCTGRALPYPGRCSPFEHDADDAACGPARDERANRARNPSGRAGDGINAPVDGYGVESGTGCFFDASAVSEVDIDSWLAAMEATSVPTWSWHVADLGAANVALFSTGAGGR
jgi:hypothetical protein